MKAHATVLVVEDDQEMRQLLEDEMREAGYDVVGAAEGGEALERLGEADVVVTDLVMPGMKGDELLAEIKVREPDVPVVIMTAFGSIDSAVEAIKSGAYHYVAKPCRMEQLLSTVANALRERWLRLELLSVQSVQAGGKNTIVSESPSMRRAVDLVLRAAPADIPVLLLGESGTGKELLARVLHSESARRKARFVAVNCSAIPETLLESQLFGHRRGSFTDAREDHRGLFQEAHGGTILLDEIGDMPHSLQVKLLRVLQEGEVHPVGAPSPVPVDVRVVAATNRDLDALVRDGRFREDLYYRLNVIAVRIPPLRERPEDLVPLIARFLEKHGQRLSRPGCTLSSEALTALQLHPWPGNVRELENVIERAMVLGKDKVLRVEDLPESLRGHHGAEARAEGIRPLDEIEREHILRTLRTVRGNKAAAARLLGLDRKTLYRKLEAYGIHSS